MLPFNRNHCVVSSVFIYLLCPCYLSFDYKMSFSLLNSENNNNNNNATIAIFDEIPIPCTGLWQNF